MRRRLRIGKKDGEAEGFVWITFSDLLTTLFMVFMVIALWAISSRDDIAKKSEVQKKDAEVQKKEGEKCLSDLSAANQTDLKKKEALASLGRQMTAEFAVLQKSGICRDANIEEISGTGGFRIFQQQGLKPWFEDSKAELSDSAKSCLRGIGEVWIRQVNSNKDLSSGIKNFLIEGHANSNRFPGITDEENFLKNLGLSQDRALQATRFLIEEIKTLIRKDSHDLMLRELMIAQGKSSLEPVNGLDGREDLDRSKRLEFKVILGGLKDGS